MSKKKKINEEILEEAILSTEKQPYEVPKNWIWGNLNSFSSLIVDGSHNPPPKKNEGYPMLSGRNVLNGKINFETDRYVSEEDYQKEYRRTPIEPNDVLLTIVGTIGRTTVVPQEYSPFVLQRSVALIKPKINSNYLAYYFSSPYFQSYLQNNAKGTAQKGVYLKTLKSSVIPLPPFNEQKRIAEILERLLNKIEEAKHLIEEAKKTFELRRASILNQLFEKNHFVTLDENKEKRIPYKLPEGWKWKKLSEIGGLKRGKSKHRPRNDKKLFDGPYPFIQTGDVARAEKFIESYNQTLSEFGLAQSALFEEGTLCITIAANIADTALLAFDSCFPDSVVGFNSNHEYISNDYIHYYISTIKQELEHYAPATAQKNINLKVLNEVLVPVPPKDKYSSIMKVINSLEKKEDFALKQIDLERNIENLKQSILSKAFKGELGTTDPNDEPAIEFLKSIL